MAVMTSRFPNRINDLLGYASLIAKASKDYEGMHWLSYDMHFRKFAAAKQLTNWSQTEVSYWTLYFSHAKMQTGSEPTSAEKGCPESKTTQGKSVEKLPSKQERLGRQESQ